MSTYTPNSQLMKLTAVTAMPTPKTIPAIRRLEPPSPKAKARPPTTIAMRLRALAIVVVKLVRNTVTAFSQGPDCAKLGVVATSTNTTRMKSVRRDDLLISADSFLAACTQQEP